MISLYVTPLPLFLLLILFCYPLRVETPYTARRGKAGTVVELSLLFLPSFQWVVRYPSEQVSFLDDIPLYTPYHTLAGQLLNYFRQQKTDTSMIIIVDVPGAGKTATVSYAVSQVVGAGYMRVRAIEKSGSLNTLKERAAKKCEEWVEQGQKFTREQLEANLDPLCRASLYRLFELYHTKVARTKVC